MGVVCPYAIMGDADGSWHLILKERLMVVHHIMGCQCVEDAAINGERVRRETRPARMSGWWTLATLTRHNEESDAISLALTSVSC